MNIDIQAKVMCTDGTAGSCTGVIVNPAALRLTHILVQESEEPATERLVPLDSISSTDAEGIKLGCTRGALTILDKAVVLTHVRVRFPDYANSIGPALKGEPIPEVTRMVLEPQVNIPPDEMAIDSNTRVEATDGKVGQVEGLEAEPRGGRLIALVVREGPPWDQKCVAIPAAEIDLVESQVVYLKLGKRDVGAMPVVPVGKKKGEQDMDTVLDQLERESEAFERNLLKLEEQFAQGNAENRASMQHDINTLRQQRDAARAQVKANLEQAKREADARLETLHDQLREADEQQKASIEKRMAEVQLEQKTLAEKLAQTEASIKDTMRFDFSEGGKHDSAQ